MYQLLALTLTMALSNAIPITYLDQRGGLKLGAIPSRTFSTSQFGSSGAGSVGLATLPAGATFSGFSSGSGGGASTGFASRQENVILQPAALQTVQLAQPTAAAAFQTVSLASNTQSAPVQVINEPAEVIHEKPQIIQGTVQNLEPTMNVQESNMRTEENRNVNRQREINTYSVQKNRVNKVIQNVQRQTHHKHLNTNINTNIKRIHNPHVERETVQHIKTQIQPVELIYNKITNTESVSEETRPTQSQSERTVNHATVTLPATVQVVAEDTEMLPGQRSEPVVYPVRTVQSANTGANTQTTLTGASASLVAPATGTSFQTTNLPAANTASTQTFQTTNLGSSATANTGSTGATFQTLGSGVLQGATVDSSLQQSQNSLQHRSNLPLAEQSYLIHPVYIANMQQNPLYYYVY